MKAFKGGNKPNTNNEKIDPNLLKVIQKHEQDGHKVIANQGDNKYSSMLLEMVKPFQELSGDIEELDYLINIASIAYSAPN